MAVCFRMTNGDCHRMEIPYETALSLWNDDRRYIEIEVFAGYNCGMRKPVYKRLAFGKSQILDVKEI